MQWADNGPKVHIAQTNMLYEFQLHLYTIYYNNPTELDHLSIHPKFYPPHTKYIISSNYQPYKQARDDYHRKNDEEKNFKFLLTNTSLVHPYKSKSTHVMLHPREHRRGRDRDRHDLWHNAHQKAAAIVVKGKRLTKAQRSDRA